MSPIIKNRLGISLYALWLVLFLAGFGLTLKSAARLYQNRNRLTLETRHLSASSTHIRRLVGDVELEGKDLAFLQNLFNLMPQTEAYVRTQKALMSEVENLRHKINHRLKGRYHILIDTKANVLYLKDGSKLILQADCSVGRGGLFTDKASGRRWEFVTPRGKFKVLEKMKNPIWFKPDWAFIEEKKPIPLPDAPERKVEGELGAYVFNLGDGYLIHGTKREELLGQPASHGCVRLGATALQTLYERVPIGTEVFIY